MTCTEDVGVLYREQLRKVAKLVAGKNECRVWTVGKIQKEEEKAGQTEYDGRRRIRVPPRTRSGKPAHGQLC